LALIREFLTRSYLKFNLKSLH